MSGILHSSKLSRGQALLELLGIIPPFLLLLSILVFAGWWTYSRLNAISHSYFMMAQFSSYNQPEMLDPKDKSGNDITTGRPYWDHSGYYGSQSVQSYVEGFDSRARLLDVFIYGVIMPADKKEFYPDGRPVIDLPWNAPIMEKYGYPKSTLPGSFCLYCSDDLSQRH